MFGGAATSGSPFALVKNILTPEEADRLSLGRMPLDHPLVRRVVACMAGGIVDQSYARVENKADGHDWHYDTGDGDHMLWCRWSASVLLSPPDDFSGGNFEIAEPRQSFKHYLDALIYPSSVLHRVTPHTGTRRVLLVFLGDADVQ